MTEEEAKTKWCPFARHVIDTSNGPAGSESFPTGNRFGGTAYDKECLCIGSACMAWRWSDQAQNYTEDHLGNRTYMKRRGFCGLAGKP